MCETPIKPSPSITTGGGVKGTVVFAHGFNNLINYTGTISSEYYKSQTWKKLLAETKEYFGIYESKDDVPKNPLAYIESNVPDNTEFVKVHYLNDSDAIPFAGHSAIILETKQGEGYYYSVTGNYGPSVLGTLYGSYVQGGISTVSNKDGKQRTISINDINNSIVYNNSIKIQNVAKISGGYDKDYYDRAISIPITNEEGWAMLDKAEELRTDPNFAYNLYENNCGQVSQLILAAGGKDFALSNWSADDEKEAIDFIAKNNIGIILSFVIIGNVYIKDRRDYTIPNAAYEEGVRLINGDSRYSDWEYYEYHKNVPVYNGLEVEYR